MAELASSCADRPLAAPRQGRWRHAGWSARLLIAAIAAVGLGSASRPPRPVDMLSPMAAGRPASASALPGSDIVLSGDAALAANHRRPLDQGLEQVGAFRFDGGAEDFVNALDCLAAAAYYEAGDDPGGQAAVAQVVVNRLRHPAFPKSVCAVVFEGSERSTGCQFTFTCDGSLARKPGAGAWTRARRTAAAALAGHVDARVGTATHYHADYVLPYWAPSLLKLAEVGRHIFYRWPGRTGGSAALRDPRPAREIMAAGLAPAIDGAEPSTEAIVPPSILPEEPTGFANAFRTLPLAPAMPDSTIMTLADETVPAGRWAISAMNACGTRRDCVVLAYNDAEAVRRNRLSSAESRETPLFLFVRDASSGMDIALWDCLRVQRPSSAQCLPEAPSALARLMRDRG